MFAAKNLVVFFFLFCFFFSIFDIKEQHFCFLLKHFFENVKKVYGRGVLERVGRVTVNTTFFRLSRPSKYEKWAHILFRLGIST